MDSLLSSDRIPDVSTLSERVEWILENRARPDGRPWSQRGLSAASGLSPAHVGMMLRGDAKAVKGETLTGLARAASVSLRWLVTGEGSPDHDDDARAPSTTDDATPIMANVPGWEDTVKVDRAEHPDITDVEVSNGERIAAYMLHRPAVRGDLWEIVQQMRRVNDPTWLAQKLRESDARVQKLIEGLPEQIAWEQEQLAKKRGRQ